MIISAEHYNLLVEKQLENYEKLILAVKSKHKGESRYHTALRYIQEAEKLRRSPSNSSSP